MKRQITRLFSGIALIILFSFQTSMAQCDNTSDCAICDVGASISMISGGSALVDVSSVDGPQKPWDTTEGSPFVIQTEGCGAMSLTIDLNFNWQDGGSSAWLHGVSFMASSGWQVSMGVPPSDDWFFLDSITGCCSGTTYGAGYYYDDPNTTDGSNCGTCGDDTEGDPSDNFGVLPASCCPQYGYNLVYCPTVAMDTVTEMITFILTEDGESGGWSDVNGCNFQISFPITIINSGFADFPSQVGPICAGEEITINTVDDCDTYLWSTGDTTSSITVDPDTTTTYTVVLGNMNGCEITRTTEVLVEPSCELTLQPMYGPICPGDCVVLTASTTCTDLEWSTGDTGVSSITVCPTETMNYTVTTSEVCGSNPLIVTTQVTVRDENDPACEEIAVPTLGEWGIIALFLILGIFAVVAIRSELKQTDYAS